MWAGWWTHEFRLYHFEESLLSYTEVLNIVEERREGCDRDVNSGSIVLLLRIMKRVSVDTEEKWSMGLSRVR